MSRVIELERAANLVATSKPMPARQPVDAATGAVVNDVIRELQACYTAWRQAWPDDKALNAYRKSLIKAFAEAGITSLEQVRYAMQRCRQDAADFAPSAGKLVQWCQPTPEMLGLPPLERAYAEVCRNVHPCQAPTARWSHAAIYHAAVAAGFSNLQLLPRDAGLKLFGRHYDAVCRRLGDGEELPPAPVAALPAPLRKGSPEVANEHLAKMRARLGGGRG